MKTLTTPLLLLLLLLFLFPGAFPGTAPAQQGQPNRPGPADTSENHDRIRKFFADNPEADADKDGILTMDEVRAYNRRKREGQPSSNPDDKKRQGPRNPEPTHADVSYGDHPQQAFDIWLAESKDGKPTPLCIYIHGGGFQGGDKRGVSPGKVQPYLREGISFVSMNYRLTNGGEFPYPVAMHDSARGLQFIRSKAKEWNLDPERVACFGGSAGAGISLWLAFHDDLADPDSDDLVAQQSTRIVAAGTSGGQSTYDMRTFKEWFELPDLVPHPALIPFYAVESPDDWESERVIKLMEDASSINHLTRDDVPVFMSYGKGDLPVTMDSSAGFWVHHARLGLKLKEAMDKLDLECHVTWNGHPSDQYDGMQEFLIAKLTEAGSE